MHILMKNFGNIGWGSPDPDDADGSNHHAPCELGRNSLQMNDKGILVWGSPALTRMMLMRDGLRNHVVGKP